jgi:hypothetical protein
VILVATGTIVAIVVAIVVIAAVVIMLMAAARRRRLQQRFGPEYDRLVDQRDSKRKAEAELSERERRVQGLDIRPLTPSARAEYANRWAGLQERFVDQPAEAVAASQVLVVAVMTERGYPAEHRDQVLADLSVEHAKTLNHYRAAEQISQAAAAGTASTEDLRQGVIHYRALFRELLGDPADAASGPAGPGQPGDRTAADVPASEPAAAARLAGASGSVPAADPVDAPGPAAYQRVDADQPVPYQPVDAGEPIGESRPEIPVQRTPRS